MEQLDDKQVTADKMEHEDDKQVTAGEVKQSDDKQVTAGEMKQLDDKQVTTDEVKQLDDKQVTTDEVKQLDDKQVTTDEVKQLDDKQVTTDEVKQLDDKQVTTGELKQLDDKQVTTDEVKQLDDKQLAAGDIRQPEIEQVSAVEEQKDTSGQISSVKEHKQNTDKMKPDVVEISQKISGAGAEEKSSPKVEVEEKKSSKDSTRNKRKEDKAIEHVLKALSSLETTEEKLAALCKKYTELLDEHRLLQNSHKQMQKKFNQLLRERDQLQSEQSKTVLAKSKLESLCRELQKHNKIIKDESVARAKEEEEKRKEVTAKFQATINDIQQQMNENFERNNKLRGENMELANKLKNLIEQYELREQHIEKIFKHKELELQLVEAKLAQANVQRTEEHERHIKEKQQILEAACQSQKKIEVQEQQLRNQVALYTGKYEEFQTTLAKSNEVFQSFKSEMDTMTKKIKKLEKETVMWRTRWENSNKKLLEMAEYKTRSDKETLILNSKIQKLENLCRALQEERKKLAARLPSEEKAAMNGVVPNQETPAEPTKTPPNTPEGGTSRGSPVTVEEKTVTDSSTPANDTCQKSDPSLDHSDGMTQLNSESVPCQPAAKSEVTDSKLEAVIQDESCVGTVSQSDNSTVDCPSVTTAQEGNQPGNTSQPSSQLETVHQPGSQSDAIHRPEGQSEDVSEPDSQSEMIPKPDGQPEALHQPDSQSDDKPEKDNSKSDV